MKIIQKRRIFFVISGALLALSVFAISAWKLKLGVDFTGGVLMEFNFSQEAPPKEDIQKKLEEFNLGSLSIQPTQTNSFILRFTSDDDSISEKVEKKIEEEFSGAELRHVEFVSSVISNELKRKAFGAVAMAVLGVALYIAWAFRKVSFPVESWKYGVAAVIALIHDVVITIGVFAFLGKFKGVEVNIPFIAALLTILGYSVNDTIVVFDRILFIDCSPKTHRSASAIFDLPLPLGPTIAVMPIFFPPSKTPLAEKSKTVLEANDLKPVISILFRNIYFFVFLSFNLVLNFGAKTQSRSIPYFSCPPSFSLKL